MKFHIHERKTTFLLLLGLLLGGSVIETRWIFADCVETEGGESVAIADTYINSEDTLTNYGGQDNLHIGEKQSVYYYSYITFDVNDLSVGYNSAEISLTPWWVYITYHIEVFLIDEEWNEYSLTFDNAPVNGPSLANVTLFNDNNNIIIDVFDVLKTRSNLSICLTCNVTDNGYFNIYSKEASFDHYRPKITYIIEESEGEYMNLYHAIIILCVFAFGYLLYDRGKKSYASRDDIPIFYNCPHCNTLYSVGAQFCVNCRKKL